MAAQFLKHGLYRHRGPPGAKHQSFLSTIVHIQAQGQLLKAEIVRVVAVEASVRPPDQGVDAAQFLSRGGQLLTVGDHRLFIRNGHVDAVPGAMEQKILQFLRSSLAEAVGPTPQQPVDGGGIAVAQTAAQKSVCAHQTTSE